MKIHTVCRPIYVKPHRNETVSNNLMYRAMTKMAAMIQIIIIKILIMSSGAKEVGLYNFWPLK